MKILMTTIISLSIGYLSIQHLPVYASSRANDGIIILDFIQRDLDGNGSPDVAVIMCVCVTESDRILVVDRNDDMEFADDWESGTDIQNDVWVIDIANDGKANLVVAFGTEDGRQVASLYDDIDRDGQVAYSVETTGNVTIQESPYSSMKVISEDSWLLSSGQPNLNLTVSLDKPLPSEQMTASVAQLYLPHDGEPDWEYKIVDNNYDGAPEYAYGRLLADIPSYTRVGRAILWNNSANKRSIQPASAWFWPFLDFVPAEASTFRYFDRVPSVNFDWQTSQIANYFLQGYPIEEGFHVITTEPIEDGIDNVVDYEMPQAYYDLAEDGDGVPELHIRVFSPALPENELRWQEIRYSWSQFDSEQMVWDYKLGLMDEFVAPTEQIAFDDFQLQLIPHSDLPYQVTERDWKLTTFVARESGVRISSEGIYLWSPWSGSDPISNAGASPAAFDVAVSYMSGTTELPPKEFFAEIAPGFRGEYHFEGSSRPLLYVSPVDHRLHLFGSEFGVSRLSPNQYVFSDDINQDGFVDHWAFVDRGNVSCVPCLGALSGYPDPYRVLDGKRQELYVLPPYVIYVDAETVAFKEVGNVGTNLAVRTSLPPRNNRERTSLLQRISPPESQIELSNLDVIFQQYEGPVTEIHGTRLSDFRYRSGGFRFIMALGSNYKVGRDDLSIGVDLSVGSHIVINDGVSWFVTPWVAPALSLELHVDLASMSNHLALPIFVLTTNRGLSDATDLTVVVTMDTEESTTVIARKPIDVLAESSTKVVLQWQAKNTLQAGTLRVRVENQAGENIDSNAVVISGLSANQFNPGTHTGLAGTIQHKLAALVVLFVFMSFLSSTVVCSSWHLWQSR